MNPKTFSVSSLRFWIGLTVAAVAVAVSGGGTFAADVDRDPSFGTDGALWFHMTNFTVSSLSAIAVQPDGKIVVGGSTVNGIDYDFAVARFNSEGNMWDTSFSIDGKAYFDYSGGDDFLSEIVIQPDGKIVAVGEATGPTGRGIAVVRFDALGSLDDTGFIDFPGDAAGHGAVLQADGKLVVVGKNYHTSSTWDYTVVRFTTDLDLDTSFATAGRYTVDFGDNGYDCAYEVAIASDGGIVTAGTGSWLGQNQMVVMWFTSAGISTGGAATTFADPAFGYGLALQPDDKPVVVGKTDTYGGIVALARFETSGVLDSSFSSDGMTALNFSNGIDIGMDLAIQHGGKIMLTGYVNDAGYDRFLLARTLENGSPDYSFNNPWSHTTYQIFDTENARSHAIAQQPDGKILIAGFTGSRSAMIRYVGDANLIFVDGFEWGSPAWWTNSIP